MKTNRIQSNDQVATARHFFVTGATGNIGAAVVARLLTEDGDATFTLLVRGESVVEATRRVAEVVSYLSPEIALERFRNRVTILTGDITEKHLGLDQTVWARVAKSITHLIHSAAATKFLLPLPCAREINVTGTANVLALARQAQRSGRLQQMLHVSTAYVCGDREGAIAEEEMSRPAEFSNAYEQTKWEGEGLVRRAMSELPVTIARPSVVVGDSRTGRTTAFNVLYTPLRMIYDHRLSRIPAMGTARLDVVPLDYVADGITAAALNHANVLGQTLNLTAGYDNSLNTREIIDRAIELYERESGGGDRWKVGTIPPRLFKLAASMATGRTRRLVQVTAPYAPYLTSTKKFDDTNTRRLLGPLGIRPPHLADYLAIILKQALAANWGRDHTKAVQAA